MLGYCYLLTCSLNIRWVLSHVVNKYAREEPRNGRDDDPHRLNGYCVEWIVTKR